MPAVAARRGGNQNRHDLRGVVGDDPGSIDDGGKPLGHNKFSGHGSSCFGGGSSGKGNFSGNGKSA